MDFIDSMRELSNTVSKRLEQVETEEGTKNALVMPFIKILGYDIHDPTEVVPEYTCDAPGKNGEKVDYALMKDGKSFMLVECKFAHDELQAKHTAQLLKYFNSITELKVGVLTNGVIYKFYTDLEHVHIMDQKPFLEINMLDLDNNLVEELKGYKKESPPHPIDLRERAKELKYTREIKRIFENELEAPSDEFVDFFAKGKHVYAGKARITKNVRDDFRNYIKKALKEVINKKITDALKSTIEKTDGKEPEPQPPLPDPIPLGIVTTKEEKEGCKIVREMLQEITDYERISYKDWKNYCNVILDDKNNKPICRFYFNKKQKYIGLFDSKVEEKVPIGELDDIRKYADKLKATISYYDGIIDIQDIQLEFWNGFKKYAESTSDSLQLTHEPHPQNWYNIGFGRPKAHISLTINVNSNLLRCEIYIPDSKELFNELFKQKDEIEDNLNEKLEWMELPSKKASNIRISRPDNINEPYEREEQFEWFKTQAELFQKVFPKYIR
ncbi:MAG: DUF4268 domain-containing protein [Euryarchaeota archaeon]|nr:DUF4268 domain-containing protein [Euryarchaeota archaeon]